MNPQPNTVADPDESWHVHDDDPFATPDRLPDGVAADAVSRFGDHRWYLTPLSQRNTAVSQTVNWERFPAPLRASFRRAGWALVNLPTPAEMLERAATSRVEWPRPGTMQQVFLGWHRFANWLCKHGIAGLHEVNEDSLLDYAVHVGTLARSTATRQDALHAVSLLWGFAPNLPASDRIPMPAWETEGMRHYLPTDADRNENSTPAIHPAVMSPLLIWALRFVDFADDIIVAWEEHQRLVGHVQQRPNPAATLPLRAFLDRCVAENNGLPGGIARGRPGVAALYLAGLFNTSDHHVKYEATKYRKRNIPVSLQAPLGTPIRGLLHGKPWKSHINFHEAPILMTRLATACMIVILYLSGVRPGEALELQAGCCPEPADDGTGSIRYELHGLFFKNARDPDGKPAPGGAQRAIPWIVLPPVADAVRVLERIVRGPWLFPTNPPWTIDTRGRRQRTGQALTCLGANARIATFIAWINDYTNENNLAAERIPDDPDGNIVVSRFRRTVAWHIARLPGGRIALAIQYGHLRATTVAEGYAGRARQGLRRVLDVETARAMADYLDTLADDLQHGEGVSGPAAGRMIQAARNARARFQGKFLTPKQADALFDEPEFNVYDNPDAFLTCNNDPTKALCHPERTRRTKRIRPPATDRCDPACANIARTDTHIQLLQTEIANLSEEVTSPLTPTPLRERLKQRSTALQRIVDRHEQTKIVPAHPKKPGHNDRRGRTPGHPRRHGTALRRNTAAVLRQPRHRDARRRGGTEAQQAHPQAHRPQGPVLHRMPNTERCDRTRSQTPQRDLPVEGAD